MLPGIHKTYKVNLVKTNTVADLKVQLERQKVGIPREKMVPYLGRQVLTDDTATVDVLMKAGYVRVRQRK